MNEKTRAFFGRKVRAARRAAGLTQRDLAGLIDTIHQPDVSDIELGKANPTLDTMRAIADALSVSLVELLPED